MVDERAHVPGLVHAPPATDVGRRQTSGLGVVPLVPLDEGEVDAVAVVIVGQTEAAPLSAVVCLVRVHVTGNDSSTRAPGGRIPLWVPHSTGLRTISPG